MPENKTQPTNASVDEFIGQIENRRRHSDALATLELYQSVTGLPPVMWGPTIIGFGTHRYRTAGGREGTVPAAGFSPRKAKLVFYVGEGFDEADQLYAALGKHKRSVSCLYINKLDDVNLDVLREIVARDFAATVDRSDA